MGSYSTKTERTVLGLSIHLPIRQAAGRCHRFQGKRGRRKVESERRSERWHKAKTLVSHLTARKNKYLLNAIHHKRARVNTMPLPGPTLPSTSSFLIISLLPNHTSLLPVSEDFYEAFNSPQILFKSRSKCTSRLISILGGCGEGNKTISFLLSRGK